MMDDMRIANPPPIMTFLEGILVQVAGASNAGVARSAVFSSQAFVNRKLWNSGCLAVRGAAAAGRAAGAGQRASSMIVRMEWAQRPHWALQPRQP
jgi:hypothetical protein